MGETIVPEYIEGDRGEGDLSYHTSMLDIKNRDLLTARTSKNDHGNHEKTRIFPP